MTDRLTPERRSWLMSRVRSKNTSPEIRVRRLAHAMGLRFRLYRNDLPGRPDLVFPRHRAVLFVHGCFWHRHSGCAKASTPKSRMEFWRTKFELNVERDRQNEAMLLALGWRVFIIWECETKSEQKIRSLLSGIAQNSFEH
ncbi:very short patch repair endonuclease [Labrys neptuniae]|uniref:very short patch repair endonuclease n=1 Tax=Labrys neptuniae TaxID=376174 RepID=UPI00288E791C|nr:very short patch repair endonuclease [Labrys neptuniae]MDT3377411.1 very short patch repair endonuclease [Labrys neptuniae]